MFAVVVAVVVTTTHGSGVWRAYLTAFDHTLEYRKGRAKRSLDFSVPACRNLPSPRWV